MREQRRELLESWILYGSIAVESARMYVLQVHESKQTRWERTDLCHMEMRHLLYCYYSRRLRCRLEGMSKVMVNVARTTGLWKMERRFSHGNELRSNLYIMNATDAGKRAFDGNRLQYSMSYTISMSIRSRRENSHSASHQRYVWRVPVATLHTVSTSVFFPIYSLFPFIFRFSVVSVFFFSKWKKKEVTSTP